VYLVNKSVFYLATRDALYRLSSRFTYLLSFLFIIVYMALMKLSTVQGHSRSFEVETLDFLVMFDYEPDLEVTPSPTPSVVSGRPNPSGV